MKFTQLFLRAKHWQLFLLLFGVPMIFYFVALISILTELGPSEPELLIIYDFFKFFPFIVILIICVFSGWIWSVAIGLQNKVPSHIKMKITKFKILFFIPFIYNLLLCIGMVLILMYISEIDKLPGLSVGATATIVAVIIPLHLFSFFCVLYSFYFVAKTFKTVELQRETSFSDFVGEFLLIWIYLIGIWIIQPKVNKMVETSNDDLKLMSELR